jgi:hypothetical protein
MTGAAVTPTKMRHVASHTRNIACTVCGRSILHRSGRRPQVCSTRCRNRKNGRRRVRKAFLTRDTGGAAKRAKNNNQTKALEWAQKQSSTRIIGPAEVIAVELNRVWQAAISSDGIPIEVGRLRQRALVDDGWRDWPAAMERRRT